MTSSAPPSSYSLAPTYSLPSTSYALIEYPGPVASTSTTSHSQAIKTLGGIPRLSRALHAQDGVVEINFRPDVPFSHTVGGENLTSSSSPDGGGGGCNVVLLKVVKKRRRRTDKTKIVGEKVVDDRGVYKVDVMGVVDKLVRFRGELVTACIASPNAILNSCFFRFQAWQIYNINQNKWNQMRLLN